MALEDYYDYRGDRVEATLHWIGLHELEQQICVSQGIKMGDMACARKTSAISKARILFTFLAVGRYGHRVHAVADHLNKNTGSVSRWLSIVREAKAEDHDLQNRIDRLYHHISAALSSKSEECEIVTRGT